jgi:hypothetical protein
MITAARLQKTIARGTISLVLALLLGGCVSAKKYRLSKADTPAAIPVDWRGEQEGVTAQVRNVITFKGPGSWKLEARWDEYVLFLSNSSAAPVSISSAVLVDLHGTAQSPGTDPWSLEKQSYTNWEKYGKAGLKLSAGAGAVMLYTGAVGAAASGMLLAGGTAGASAVALNAIPAVAVIDIAVVIGLNRANRTKVEREFARRRISLPFALPAGATAAGSLFFPMTPAPRELVLRGDRAGEAFELHVPLPALAQLHLQGRGK